MPKVPVVRESSLQDISYARSFKGHGSLNDERERREGEEGLKAGL